MSGTEEAPEDVLQVSGRKPGHDVIGSQRERWGNGALFGHIVPYSEREFKSVRVPLILCMTP